MSKQCTICHRVAISGNLRSHSNIATKRRMFVNLQRRTIDGRSIMICTSCIKTRKKKKKS